MIVDGKGNIFQDRRKKENECKTVKNERRNAPPQQKKKTVKKTTKTMNNKK